MMRRLMKVFQRCPQALGQRTGIHLVYVESQLSGVSLQASSSLDSMSQSGCVDGLMQLSNVNQKNYALKVSAALCWRCPCLLTLCECLAGIFFNALCRSDVLCRAICILHALSGWLNGVPDCCMNHAWFGSSTFLVVCLYACIIAVFSSTGIVCNRYHTQTTCCATLPVTTPWLTSSLWLTLTWCPAVQCMITF